MLTVTTKDWYEWRSQLADRYEGLIVTEQLFRRSHREKLCAECGDGGTVEHRSVIVACVPSYFLCEDCDTYWASRAEREGA